MRPTLTLEAAAIADKLRAGRELRLQLVNRGTSYRCLRIGFSPTDTVTPQSVEPLLRRGIAVLDPDGVIRFGREPVRAMNPRLPELVVQVEAMLARPDPYPAVDHLVSEDGATVRFVGGAYVFRMAGVGGSSTMDRHGALASWLRCARRKIERVAP